MTSERGSRKEHTMPGRFTQANRMMRVKFAHLDDDELLLNTFTGTEQVNELFSFQLDLLAELPLASASHFEQVIGQPVTVTFRIPEGGERTLHGIVNRFSQGLAIPGPEGHATFICFRAEMVPRMWRLTKSVNCRIFQHKSVPDILAAMFKGLDVENHLQGDHYPQREYCTQYRESDYAFVSRLMEEEGICFSFRHDQGKDILILRDAPPEQPNLPGEPRVQLIPDWQKHQTLEDCLYSWEKTQELASGSYTVSDYLFQMPDASLSETHQINETLKVGAAEHKLDLTQNKEQLEVFDYPGGYAHHPDAGPTPAFDSGEFQEKTAALGSALLQAKQRVARLRMEQVAAASIVCTGTGDVRSFNAGCRFALTSDLRYFDGHDDYVLTSVTHQADMNGAYTRAEAPDPVYRNEFRCLPAALPFRPQRRTPQPRIAGVQTAIVVGTDGTDVSTDAYGRVRVQFFWDRAGQRQQHNQKGELITTFNFWPGEAPREPTSSCWVRVAQSWAGRKFGAIFIPRLGQEVVVAFEDGDPDRPLVLGGVYNYINQPPFPLPAGNEISGVKTYSPGGDEQAFSGLAFSDNPGNEIVYLQSEQRLVLNAEQDLVLNVGRDLIFNINGKQRITQGTLPGLG